MFFFCLFSYRKLISTSYNEVVINSMVSYESYPIVLWLRIQTHQLHGTETKDTVYFFTRDHTGDSKPNPRSHVTITLQHLLALIVIRNMTDRATPLHLDLCEYTKLPVNLGQVKLECSGKRDPICLFYQRLESRCLFADSRYGGGGNIARPST